MGVVLLPFYLGESADVISAIDARIHALAVVRILEEKKGDAEEQLPAEVDYECPEEHSDLLVTSEWAHSINQAKKGLLSAGIFLLRDTLILIIREPDYWHCLKVLID